MNTYLLAINLFAIAALFLALVNFTTGVRQERLLPLFLLVITHSVQFIISILTGGHPPGAIEVLTIFGTFCVIWALIGPTEHLAKRWRRLMWAGVFGSISLILLPLIPAWPVPPPIHSLMIAIFGTSLIFMTSLEWRWPPLLVPFVLGMAQFLALLDLDNTAGFVTLIAYVLFIGVIHWQNIITYARQEKLAQAFVQEALDSDQEKQRLIEVSEQLHQMPNPNQALEHISQTLAQATHVDQVAIFTLDSTFAKEIRLLTLYSPRRPFHLNSALKAKEATCLLQQCPLLEKTIVSQQQQRLSAIDDVDQVYALWDEQLAGPTLLQPLMLKGQPTGVLMLGNPFSQAPIRAADARLSQHLAGQIALLVEHRRRYLKLEEEADLMTKAAKRQTILPNLQQTAILQSINDGVVVSNTDGRVQYVNRAAERILGQPAQKLIGQPIGSIYGNIDAKEPIEDMLVSFSRRDHPLPTFIENAEQAIQGRLIPWRNPDSEWLGIIAIFRDVTREVKADQARNDFINALSREVRAPLTAVKGYSELITQGMIGDYSPQQIHVQQIIHSNADRVVEVLDNAVKISAESRHKILPRYEEINICKILENVLREIAPVAEIREVSLTHDFEPGLPPLIADAKHIYRIFYNLLSNACRFTPPGGQIKVKTWLQEDVWGRTSQPLIYASVTDNGVGISKKDLTRVFDRFYRAKSPLMNGEDEGGMGLGLTVVKELVELHHGRVWVESILGEGSSFYIALPVTQEY